MIDLARPRALTALLDCTFALQRQWFGVFFTVTALVNVPMVIGVEGIWQRELRYGAHPHGRVVASLVAALLGAFIVPAMVTALHVRIVQRLGEGEAPTVGKALRWVAPAVGPAILATMAYAVGTGLGFFALFVPGVILLVRWFAAPQVAIVEGNVPGLRRSGQLVEGQWWTVAGRLLAMWVISAVLVSIPVQLAGEFVHPAWIYVAARAVLGTIGASLSALFGTLLYFSLRADREPASSPAPIS